MQLTDMYSFNYGYVGSRATGNGAGCYIVTAHVGEAKKPMGTPKFSVAKPMRS